MTTHMTAVMTNGWFLNVVIVVIILLSWSVNEEQFTVMRTILSYSSHKTLLLSRRVLLQKGVQVVVGTIRVARVAIVRRTTV